MIDAEVHGSEKVIERFQKLPDSIRQKLKVTVTRLALTLRNKVVSEKLSGQVLKRRTGTLASSIKWRVDETSNSFIGIVGSRATEGKPLKYAAIHEYGGVIPSHKIEAIRAKALKFQLKSGVTMFRKSVIIPDIKMPERSYLRSSLREMEVQIRQDMERTVKQGVKNE